MHWAERYVGEPYVLGTNDCAAFVARVMGERFRRVVAFPSERDGGYRKWSQTIQQHRDAIVERIEQPDEGDVVLMVGRGYLNHIGLYCRIGAIDWVLHAMKSAGQVCLHRVRDLPSQGLALEGYYRWR